MAIVHAAHIELLEGIATNGTLEFVDDGADEGGTSLSLKVFPNL
jgi:hypothetical protein